MRVFVRAIVLLVVILAVAVGALSWYLPRWIEGAGFRETVSTLVRDQLGREIEYESVAVRLLPPRVEVEALTISGARPGDPPSIEAESASLVLGWMGLLQGRAVVDALEIDGASLRITRTAEGLDWIAAAVPAAPAAGRVPVGDPGDTSSESTGAPAVSLDKVVLRDSLLIFDDRLVSPPVAWRLEGVELVAKGDSFDAPVDFEIVGTLASGGELRGTGNFALSGEVDAHLELRELLVAPLRAYGQGLEMLSGFADIDVDLGRATDGALEAKLDLHARDAELRSGDLEIRGGVKASATLSGVVSKFSGPFALDATDAELVYAGGAYRKPIGTRAELSGTLTQDDGGLRANYELNIRNASGQGSLQSEPSFRLELATQEFDVDGWDELISAFEGLEARGPLALEGLVLSFEPMALTGGVELLGVELDVGADEPVAIDGFLDMQGNELAFRDLFVRSIGADSAEAVAVRVEGGIEDLFGDQQLSIRAATPEKIETDRLLGIFGNRGAVFGPLGLGADLTAPLGQDRTLVEELGGTFEFEIGGEAGRGRLAGVSLLEAVFEQFGALGQAAFLALPGRSGKSIESYYSDEFLRAAGSFRLDEGVAETDDLEFRHEKYGAHLRGTLRIDDLAIDMTGELRIFDDLDAALGGGGATGFVRSIPLVRVAGTVTNPRVTLRPEDVARFASYYLLGSKDNKTTRKIDEKVDEVLGEGSGGLLREAIFGIGGGLLGGGKSKTSSESPGDEIPGDESAEDESGAVGAPDVAPR